MAFAQFFKKVIQVQSRHGHNPSPSDLDTVKETTFQPRNTQLRTALKETSTLETN